MKNEIVRPKGIARRAFLKTAATATLAAGASAKAAAPGASSIESVSVAPVPVTGNYDHGQPGNAMVTGVDPNEHVLFAFDDHWIPFQQNITLKLDQPTPYESNPVLKRGAAGEPDAYFAALYGTVFRLDGKFCMWYGAVDNFEEFHPGRTNMRLAYAESEDGIHWNKPRLGLRPYRENANNNLLAINREVYNSPMVIYDPADPDPRQRFKMSFVGYHHKALKKALLCVAFSPDGFHWTEYEGNPVVHSPWAETSGLYRWNGIYYCNGQTKLPESNPKRTMVSFASADFRHWQEGVITSFHRHSIIDKGENDFSGSQVHLGASIWNRKNVLLGLYGKWENPTPADPAQTHIDLGLIISNDGQLFREPIPGHRFIPWDGEKSGWKTLRMLQAQAFVNHGDKTYIWYGGASDDTGKSICMEAQAEVGLATLPRDRFGYLNGGRDAVFTTNTLPAMPHGAEIALNVDGLGEKASLRIELLDHAFNPMPGFSGDSAASLKESGLRQVVKWPGGKTAIPLLEPYRLRVHFEGEKPRNCRFYCVYAKELTT